MFSGVLVRSKFLVSAIALLVCLCLAVVCGPATVSAGGKIPTNPGSITMNEGASQTVNVSLTQPIICPGGVTPCQVDIAITSSDPSAVSVSPSTISFADIAWASTVPVTVNSVQDGVYSADRSVSLTFTASGGAPYYSGFHFTLPVTLTNIDSVPSPAIGNKSATVVSDGGSVAVDVLVGVGGSPDVTTLAVTAPPSHGTAVLGASAGTIVYTPGNGYVGPDSLTYRVCSSLDPTVCTTATLSFVVTAPAAALVDTGVAVSAVTIAAWILMAAAIATSMFRQRQNEA